MEKKYFIYCDVDSEELAEIIAKRCVVLLSEQANANKIKEEFLTSKEAAKILKVSTVTLHQYIKEGIIPSYRIGSTIRFKFSDLEQALTNGFRKYTIRKGGNL